MSVVMEDSPRAQARGMPGHMVELKGSFHVEGLTSKEVIQQLLISKSLLQGLLVSKAAHVWASPPWPIVLSEIAAAEGCP